MFYFSTIVLFIAQKSHFGPIVPHFFEPRQASNCLPRSNIEVDTDQRKASLIFYY